MKQIKVVMLLVLLFPMVTPKLHADNHETSTGSFVVEQDIVLPASPAEVYDTITGDISPWWDHSFSAHPKKLYIEAKPGGGFYEIFDDSGDGARHATVLVAERGKRLILSGPYGFSGKAVNLVVTYDLNPDPEGTHLHLTCNVAGQSSPDWEKLVDSVWHHFLFERLKPYIESKYAPERKPSSQHVPAKALKEAYDRGVRNTSYVTPQGERVLQQEAVVSAPLEQVWKTVSTSKGLETFIAPAALVELRTGGKWWTNYAVGSRVGDPGTIKNEVLCYVPREMVAIKVNLNAGFPPEVGAAGTLFAVLHLHAEGQGKVRVTETMLGWGAGPDWDFTYKFFDEGNTYTMGQLIKRFTDGPISWASEKNREGE